MYTVDVTFKYADISSGGFYMAIIVMSFIAQIVLVLLYSFWFMPLVSLPRINWWIIVSQYVTPNMNSYSILKSQCLLAGNLVQRAVVLSDATELGTLCGRDHV